MIWILTESTKNSIADPIPIFGKDIFLDAAVWRCYRFLSLLFAILNEHRAHNIFRFSVGYMIYSLLI